MDSTRKSCGIGGVFVLIAVFICGPVVAGDDFDNRLRPSTLTACDVMPEVKSQTAPEYPREARRAGHEGTVWMRALVDVKGNVTKTKVAKSSGSKSLDESAKAAAIKNRFEPAQNDGKPVAVWIAYKVVFSLSKDQRHR